MRDDQDQIGNVGQDALNFHVQQTRDFAIIARDANERLVYAQAQLEKLRQLLFEAQLFLTLATPDVTINTDGGQSLSKTVLLGKIEYELAVAAAIRARAQRDAAQTETGEDTR